MIHLLIVSLSIIFHELGHLLVAKCVGVRVSRFCLFFDPGFHLFSTGNRFSTEYRIGWLPLGGYVKYSLPDEEEEKSKPKQRFAAQLPLKRIAISLAGVAVNMFIAYGCIFTWARVYVLPTPDYSTSYVMKKAGLVTIYRLDDYRRFLTEKYVPVLRKKEMAKSANRILPSVSSTKEERITFKRFLWRLSGMNLLLVMINILPIPPLDGAQCLFSTYHLIFRRPLNKKFMILLVLLGSSLLFGLFAYDILSDLAHFLELYI